MSDIKVKYAYHKTNGEIVNGEVVVSRREFNADTKQEFAALLLKHSKEDFGNVEFSRRSKKHKNYVTLESTEDFKTLKRSLQVKDHIRLAIKEIPRTESDGASENESERATSDTENTNQSFAAMVAEDLLASVMNIARETLTEAKDEIIRETKDMFKNTQPQASSFSVPSPEPQSRLSKDIVHLNVACDSCNTSPIKGARFKCLICDNYDLCEACQDNYECNEVMTESHTFLHPVVKIFDPSLGLDVLVKTTSDEFIHPGVGCDRCTNETGCFKDIHGIRFKCLECKDFDLCQSCYSRGGTVEGHSDDHLMIPIKKNVVSNSIVSNISKYRDLMDLIDVEDDDLKLGILKSLISEFNERDSREQQSQEQYEQERAADSLNYEAKEQEEEQEREQDQVGEGHEEEQEQEHECEHEEVEEKESNEESAAEHSESDTEVAVTPEEFVVSETEEVSSPEQYQDESADEEDEMESSTQLIPETGKAVLRVKRFGPKSQIFSVEISNLSNHVFPSGDLRFEFKSPKENLTVKNSGSLFLGKSRFYNLKSLEKFFGSKLVIRFSNDDYYLVGTFSDSVTDLLIERDFEDGYSSSSDSETDLEVKEDGKISTVLSIKSSNVAQITLLNNTTRKIDCSNLTIQIRNMLGNSVAKVLIHKRHGIEPEKSAKFNINVNSSHLKHPFTVEIDNEEFIGVAGNLSMNNLFGDFKIKNVSNSLLGSVDSMVLPSFPKEQSVYLDATEEFKDKDQDMLVDISDDDEFELGSDYEVLTPTVSNN